MEHVKEPADRAWSALLAASRVARNGFDRGRRMSFAPDGAGGLREVASTAADTALVWRPGSGWAAAGAWDDDADASLALYLPLCAAGPDRPLTLGHLGQSLDGFVATRTGDARFVTGTQNIVHLHRLRALCDAVVVGAETVAGDDPQLTTRLVSGPNPLRVVLDPRQRLPAHHQVFADGAAATLLVCEATRVQPGERFGRAEVAGAPCRDGRFDLHAVLALLHRRGCHAVFVEGGGVTVSRFLEAGLLDRLHVAIAPLVIGHGRPGLQLPPVERLRDGLRPAHRVFRMGEDVLFDCDLRAGAPTGDEPAASPLARIH
jgi:diaminohydroxyphosphoribosylaminopyrimidine deaminase / 5-amino-6-(5-phosphoribosylamino)uracil reductase